MKLRSLIDMKATVVNALYVAFPGLTVDATNSESAESLRRWLIHRMKRLGSKQDLVEVEFHWFEEMEIIGVKT